MPPERRVFSSPPRSPLTVSIPTTSSSSTTKLPRRHAPTSFVDHPNSYISSYLSNRHAKEIMLSKVQKRCIPNHQQQPLDPQTSCHENHSQPNRLQAARLQFHREEERYQIEQQRQQQQQLLATSHLHHYQPIPPLPAPLTPPDDTTSQNQKAMEAPSPSDTPSNYASAPEFSTLHTMPGSWTQGPSSLHPSGRDQCSDLTVNGEGERSTIFSNISSFRDTLPKALPPRVAKENLERLRQRLQRRRARARETILVDLHQGVKSVEAEVHRQVEMVFSRLKGAPASRYAFALTNSFLAQIPTTLSQSISGSGPTGVETSAAAERKRNEDRITTERLSKDFDSIALTSHSKRSPQSRMIEISDEESRVSISRLGASEVLSASMHTSYSTACSQVLSAALPSFIPSMVAPLVCVFAYPGPLSAANPQAEHTDDRTGPKHQQQHQQQQQQPSKELNFPWGLPGRSPFPSTTVNDRHQDPKHQIPDPGVLIPDSRSWTQAEQEALYLAATRFCLSGQWSKIREMMSLHRTDEEIEVEYTRLYGHRGDKDTDIDEDEDDQQVRAMDEDADDEAEIESNAMFMKFGGQRRQHRHHHTPRLRCDGREKEPIRLSRKELMIDKRFTLEEIPTRL
ncbi:hypothetical protein BGX20_001522 [Mortierella sp. AD010]|nr:hypothetical protein BGX20_001522 [Mortierella sp. AD010]